MNTIERKPKALKTISEINNNDHIGFLTSSGARKIVISDGSSFTVQDCESLEVTKVGRPADRTSKRNLVRYISDNAGDGVRDILIFKDADEMKSWSFGEVTEPDVIIL